jgi:hypothetical protein
MSKISNILDQIAKESDDILGVCLFDHMSGVLIAEKNVDSKIDLAIPSAYFSEFVKSASGAVKAMGIPADIDEYLITFNNFYLIIKSVKNMKHSILCYISLTGNQSYIKEILNKYEDPINKELKII